MSLVISLCDLTGNMVQPWVDAGHRAILVDPQHGTTDLNGNVVRFAGTIEDAMDYLGHSLRIRDVAMVFGFPPCTDMAVSGARWFESKRAADRMFQAKAVMVAEQCRTIGRLSGAPWFVENPVSVLSSVFGKPQHTFHPADYTAYEPADNYTKKTCLWTGGGASSCRSRLGTHHWASRITGFTSHPLDRSAPTSDQQHPWDSPAQSSKQTQSHRIRSHDAG